MSRTYRKKNYHPINKEGKVWRKFHYRKHRRAAKLAIRNGKEIPRHRKTSGWLTY